MATGERDRENSAEFGSSVSLCNPSCCSLSSSDDASDANVKHETSSAKRIKGSANHESDNRKDDLPEILSSLESRLGVLETVMKNVQEMLQRAFSGTVIQCNPNPFQSEFGIENQQSRLQEDRKELKGESKNENGNQEEEEEKEEEEEEEKEEKEEEEEEEDQGLKTLNGEVQLNKSSITMREMNFLPGLGITSEAINEQNDLNSSGNVCQKTEVNGKLVIGESCAERKPIRMTTTNIEGESKGFQACYERIIMSEAKIEEMSRRLDQLVQSIERQGGYRAGNGSNDDTELKKVITESDRNDLRVQDSSGLEERIRTYLDANLNIQSIWTVAQLSDEHKALVRLVQGVGDAQGESAMQVLHSVGELSHLSQSQTQFFQEFQRVFTEKLGNVEESVRTLDDRTKELAEMLPREIANAKNLLSADLNTEVDKLCRGVALASSQDERTQSRLREVDSSLTSTLEDMRRDMRESYVALENRLRACLVDIRSEMLDGLQTAQQQGSGELLEVRDQLDMKVWDALEILAGRLDKSKFELFSMMEKESQLVKDMIHEPTRDGNRKNFTFDFYVDNFLQRMAAGVGDQVDGRFVIANLDVCVHSFPWYIPTPVDTSFQGFVKFTAEGKIQIYLLFGRNPNELGLVPRIGRAMSCSVIVTDLSGEREDIELQTVRGIGNQPGPDDRLGWKAWNENEIRNNKRNGRFLGEVDCSDIIDRDLHTRYADGSVLFRFMISVK